MDDCIIIGGGPAGLTAAIYLARFHLSIRLLDCGDSRAGWIPCTRNHAGYPDGISGRDLLAAMLAQAEKYGAVREATRAITIERNGDDFRIRTLDRVLETRAVLLATGVKSRRPDIPQGVHDIALERGLLRYCPICDGYEVTDKRVGVVGTDTHGMKEALFLRGYTRDVTLVSPDGGHRLDDACKQKLEDAGIARVDGPCGGWAVEGDTLAFDTAQGRLAFDSVYPAMGSDIRSELAVAAGARGSEDGCLEVDNHQRTTIPGLFAAGDVVKGLDQISHAMGEGGVAATAIRNLLDERAPIRR